jgi:GTP-binding protein
VVVNKADVRGVREAAVEFHRLGLGDPFVVSSEHSQGIGELLEEIRRRLPAASAEPAEEAAAGAPPVAIVGRPNVGKSSLVNRLLGESRLLVSATPGTTRDPIDTLVERGGKRYLLVDTAGIRRRSRVSGTPEDLAVMLARRQIERSDVAVLVIDAEAGVTSGDLAVAGAIWDSARAAVVAVNKWDLLDDDSRQRLDLTWPRLAEVLAEPRRVNLSAASGRGVDKLFPLLDETLAAFRMDVQTAELNRLLERAVAAHSPPQLDGRPWRLYYATQVSSGPPTFMLFANRTLSLRDTYRRYLENRLRETLTLAGVPIRLVIRQREGR